MWEWGFAYYARPLPPQFVADETLQVRDQHLKCWQEGLCRLCDFSADLENEWIKRKGSISAARALGAETLLVTEIDVDA
jgi:hypothetical protein